MGVRLKDYSFMLEPPLHGERAGWALTPRARDDPADQYSTTSWSRADYSPYISVINRRSAPASSAVSEPNFFPTRSLLMVRI